MTREEDVIIEAKKYYRNDIKCYDAFLHGVEWAEGQIANVWHEASEEPQVEKYVLIQYEENDYDIFSMQSGDAWDIWCSAQKVIRWAYINDLLPKGCE